MIWGDSVSKLSELWSVVRFVGRLKTAKSKVQRPAISENDRGYRVARVSFCSDLGICGAGVGCYDGLSYLNYNNRQDGSEVGSAWGLAEAGVDCNLRSFATRRMTCC